MPTETTKIDSERQSDVRGSYAKLQSAADRHASEWGTQLKLGKAILNQKWASYADKAATRDLRNLCNMKATAENSRWQDVLVLNAAAIRVLESSAQNDPSRPGRETPTDAEETYGKSEPGAWERRKEQRMLFRDALARGASDEKVKAALNAGKGKSKDKADDE